MGGGRHSVDGDDDRFGDGKDQNWSLWGLLGRKSVGGPNERSNMSRPPKHEPSPSKSSAGLFHRLGIKGFGGKQAHLGDTEPSFVYDEQRKMWLPKVRR